MIQEVESYEIVAVIPAAMRLRAGWSRFGLIGRTPVDFH